MNCYFSCETEQNQPPRNRTVSRSRQEKDALPRTRETEAKRREHEKNGRWASAQIAKARVKQVGLTKIDKERRSKNERSKGRIAQRVNACAKTRQRNTVYLFSAISHTVNSCRTMLRNSSTQDQGACELGEARFLYQRKWAQNRRKR